MQMQMQMQIFTDDRASKPMTELQLSHHKPFRL